VTLPAEEVKFCLRLYFGLFIFFFVCLYCLSVHFFYLFLLLFVILFVFFDPIFSSARLCFPVCVRDGQ
jgi:hypothetical protein